MYVWCQSYCDIYRNTLVFLHILYNISNNLKTAINNGISIITSAKCKLFFSTNIEQRTNYNKICETKLKVIELKNVCQKTRKQNYRF